MESYMSLNMSAFHTGSKWKVTIGHSWGGREGCWNGNWVTMRPSLWLTWNQTEAELTVIHHQEAKNYILSLSALYVLFTFLLKGNSFEVWMLNSLGCDFTLAWILQSRLKWVMLKILSKIPNRVMMSSESIHLVQSTPPKYMFTLLYTSYTVNSYFELLKYFNFFFKYIK